MGRAMANRLKFSSNHTDLDSPEKPNALLGGREMQAILRPFG